ncbi:unnamed protein product [Coregonus sp. 'balchen']|nr:unnamed protein product [Coregonus sp. 'balchen']
MLSELFSPLLCILMVLGCVSKAQCLVKPHSCPPMVRLQGLPNRTVQAGTAFYFPLPLPAIQGPFQHYQVSLANDDAIPRWLAFTEKTGNLFGLALREDCGQYPLKVSVAGHCVSVTYFHLHVLNGTVGEGSLLSTHIKAGLVCPVGETVIWADLLLQVDTGSLDADQRVRLTSTMADYLRMAPGSVHLLSLRGPAALQSEKTGVCRQGPLTADATQGKGTSGRGQAAELLWPVGCGVGEQLSDLALILEHSTASGRLTTVLGVPILGWRILCNGLLPGIRRGLQPLRHTATPTAVLPPPTQVPESVRLELSHIPVPEPSTSLMMSYPTAILETHTGAPNLELTQASSHPLTSAVACEGVLKSPPSGTRDDLLSMPSQTILTHPRVFHTINEEAYISPSHPN